MLGASPRSEMDQLSRSSVIRIVVSMIWEDWDAVEWSEEDGGSGGSQMEVGGNNPRGRGGLEKCVYCRQRKKKVRHTNLQH